MTAKSIAMARAEAVIPIIATKVEKIRQAAFSKTPR